MNGENGWDHNVDGDVAEASVVCVSREEVLQALNEKNRNSCWTFTSIIGVGCC